VLGDGYCLFHAVSTALYGNCLHWAILRYIFHAKIIRYTINRYSGERILLCREMLRVELDENREYYINDGAASAEDVNGALRDLTLEGAFNDSGSWTTEFCNII